MAGRDYAVFPASHREAPPGASVLGDVGRDETIEVSIYLKPRDQHAPADANRAARAARRTELHRDDIRLIRQFAAEHDLTVIAVEPVRRLVRLSGPAAAIEAAFRTRLQHYHDGTRGFRGVTGALSLPENLHPIVESVLGLDTRPAASPRIVRATGAAQGYLPNEVGALYGFPGNADGSGECIGIIELSGGFRNSDITRAFAAMGEAPPIITAVSVDGATNSPTTNPDADGEVALDIQVAGGNAPGAAIAVYFAPNSEAGFINAISAAVADSTHQPSIVTISWGAPESSWSAQAITSMTSVLEDAAKANLSVFAAAGDSLATDGIDDRAAHVDFPASSPWAIGCGGTAITTANGAITGEVVWNSGTSGTGGGISDLFPVPAFQAATKLPPSVNGGRSGRGVPDVAADAAPKSGYRIVVFGIAGVVGGTSAVPPLWAALIARINQQRGKPAGFFLPYLYQHPNLVREITLGNNRPAGSTIGYDAGASWNACTGLGVPNGARLVPGLAADEG
ncbi:MAG: S53 family peptidase [Acetobacteraceae bacterium]